MSLNETNPTVNQTQCRPQTIPSNLTDDAFKEFYEKAQLVTGVGLYPIFCFIGLTGNVLSIVVLGHKKMSSSTNTYLFTMAVSDSIKLINDMFYFIVSLLVLVNPPWGQISYAYLYPYAHYFFNMSVCVTAWVTVSVAAERYIMICHATRARDLCTLGRARVISAAVSIVMSGLALPFAFRYRTVTVCDVTLNSTYPDVEVTELWDNDMFAKTFTWIHNLLRTVLPLLILCVLNCFIIKSLRQTRATKKRIPSRHKITIMLISIIIMFMICVTPDAIMSTVFGYGYTEAHYLVRGIREFTDLLLTVNAACNFLLYCTFNKVFRKQFVIIFCRDCHSLRSKDDISGRGTHPGMNGKHSKISVTSNMIKEVERLQLKNVEALIATDIT